MYTFEDDKETSSRLHKHRLMRITPPATGEDERGGEPGGPETGRVADVEQAENTGQAGNAGNSAESAGAGDVGVEPPVAAPQPPVAQKAFSPQQLSDSLKKLVLPAPAGVNGGRPAGTAALAALTIACIAVFLTSLDETVVVTALPQMISDLQVPITKLDHASWIVSAYLLGFVVVMPLMGRVSDIHGRRRIFLLCLVIFGIGSLLCGLAPLLGSFGDLALLGGLGLDISSPGLIWLIAARFFQATGGGALVPVAMAIAGDFYGHEKRGIALGIIGAVTEAGGVLGPLYGAIITERLHWQWIFYLNVPLVIVLFIAAWKYIPRGRYLRERVDWAGAFLLALALTCLSLGLAQQGTSLGPVSGPAPQNNPVALALAALFLAAFILVERKVRGPVVDLSLFRRFPFSAAALVSLLVGAALIIAMADIPIFVDTVLQLSALDSGLTLMRLTAMIPPGALLGGWLCSRITCRWTGVLGLLLTAAGFYLMSRWPARADWNQITLSTVTAGLGFGLVIAPIGTTALNAVRATQAGMSSAIMTALRMVGMTLGLAALTSWALAYFKELAKHYPALPITATAAQFADWQKGYAQHLVQSAHTVYSAVFFASMVLCLAAIIPALFLWGKQQSVAELEPEPELADLPTLPMPASTTTSMDEAQVLPAGSAASAGKKQWWRDRKRRLVFAFASIGLVLLLVGGGVFAMMLFAPEEFDDSGDFSLSGPESSVPADDPTVQAGPRRLQLALDRGALTSIFVSQLNLQQGALTDLSVTPLPGDRLMLNLNLHVDMNGIHRVMPVQLDGVIGLDGQQNLQLQVQHLKRDGLDAGPAAASRMQAAINKMLSGAVMPALRGKLQNVKLIAVHTSHTIPCGKGIEMLVLQIEAPPIQGVAAQPTPVPFCFTGSVDLNKLLPR